MWGNLRNAVANAGESGIIAKLGDVVAPQSHDEDDDYEYEQEEDEELESGEEYEYYDETEDLNDIGGHDDDDDDGVEYDEDNQMQFSPGLKNAAAVGKLFGGVLQKGKERLTETARNLVEPDQSSFDLNSNDDIDDDELRSSFSGSDVDVKNHDFQAPPPPVADENAVDVADEINTPNEDVVDFNQVENLVSFQDDTLTDEVIENVDQEFQESAFDADADGKEIETVEAVPSNGQEINETKHEDAVEQEISYPGEQNDMEEVEIDRTNEQDEEEIVDILQQESMEYLSFDQDEDESPLDEKDDAKSNETYEMASDEKLSIGDDDMEQDLTASVSEQTANDENNIVVVEQTVKTVEFSDEMVTQTSPANNSAVEENHQRLPAFEGDLMMENGNEPAAVEILDETVGHVFNLQETGLDKTIGHHTTGQHIEESQLNDTLGHHVNKYIEESELDDTRGHHSSGLHLEEPQLNGTARYQESSEVNGVTDQQNEEYENIEEESIGKSQEIPCQVDEEQVKIVEAALTESNQKVEEYRVKAFTLEAELTSANKVIDDLELKLVQSEELHRNRLKQMKAHFDDDKELLVTTAQETHAEEVQQAVKKVRDDMEKYILDLQEEMASQMEQSDQQIEQFRSMYDEACKRAESIEASSKKESSIHSHQLAEMEKRHSIALERVEKKAGKATAALDDKNAQIHELNTIIRDMKNTIKQNVEEHEAVEDEADELHEENEKLREKMELMEEEHKKMKNELNKVKEEHGKSLGVQIELQLLREERDREKEKLESLKETQNTNESTLIAERDAAKANALDLEQRLTALQADLDLAKSDYERSIMASSNLETAMEAFQIEREAELELLEETRISAEDAIKASNELALQSLRQENETAMKEVQVASNKAIENMMFEMAETEQKLEEYKKETINLRRSLDEAIHHLQTNQEDVIDRSLMKNIFLDWHSRSGKGRRDVMLVVASVLHFTEADKEKCGIGEGSSAYEKVVGAVAPPLTPAAKTVDELDGDNIREKWVNFLLAECGDSPKNEMKPPKPKTKSRSTRNTQSLEL